MAYTTPDGWQITTRDEALEQGDSLDRPRLVVPNAEEYEKTLHQLTDPRCCGMCDHFLHRMGQEQLREERVIPRAVREHQHNIAWYGNQQLYGLCDQWDGHITSAVGPINIPRHFLDSSVAYEERDRPVECPAYKPRGKGLRSLQHYVGKRRNWEE